MQTLAQYFADRPRLEVCTRNLTYNKKLRRLVASTIDKLHETTSPRDLASKVLKEINTPTNLNFLYGSDRLKSVDLTSFVYERLELPIKLCCEAFTGVVSKSLFEAQMTWQKSYVSCKHKRTDNPDVFLAPQKDANRVYVTNGSTEACIVDNIAPMAFLDSDIKDRHRFSKPQTLTFIKLNSTQALFLFHSKSDGLQRRFQIPFERVKHLTFQSLDSAFQQDGLQVVPKELTGKEFEVSTFGEVVGEKRIGVSSSIWVFDQTNRGRTGDQGLKGVRGETGQSNDIKGQRISEVMLNLAKQGKRLVTTKSEYEKAFIEKEGWVLPMKKSLLDQWKTK